MTKTNRMSPEMVYTALGVIKKWCDETKCSECPCHNSCTNLVPPGVTMADYADDFARDLGFAGGKL